LRRLRASLTVLLLLCTDDRAGNNQFFCGGRCVGGPSMGGGQMLWCCCIMPLFMIWALSVAASDFTSFTAVVDGSAVPVGGFLVAEALVLFACSVAFFLLTALTDPGIVPKGPKPPPGAPDHGRPADVPPNRYCRQCYAEKPRGAHHCHICDACVMHIDHHCPVFGTCIAARNMVMHAALAAAAGAVRLCVPRQWTRAARCKRLPQWCEERAL
jgi:hypothetical protein